MNHLVILPILIPLLGAALSLFVEHRRYGRHVRRAVAWTAMAALAAAVIALFVRAGDGQVQVYLLGDWPSPARTNSAITAAASAAIAVQATARRTWRP